MLDPLTVISCSVIVIAFVWALYYISHLNDEQFQEKRNWVEQLPGLISTLGVLGTFLGITIGLLGFDTSKLDDSIPKLLNGMKTAFFTSLFGMAGSLFLNRKVSHRLDKEQKETEVEKATRLIVHALNTNGTRLNQTVADNYSQLSKKIVSAFNDNTTMQALFRLIHQDFNQVKDDVEMMKSEQEGLKDTLAQLTTASGFSVEEMQRLRAVLLTATASINSIDNNLTDVKAKLDAMGVTADETKTLLEDKEEKSTDAEEENAKQAELEALKDSLSKLVSAGDATTEELSRLRAVLLTATASINNIDNNLTETSNKAADKSGTIVNASAFGNK